MILTKEFYTQQDGHQVIKCFCKNGYFYISADVIDLLEGFSWDLHKEHNTNHGTMYVTASVNNLVKNKYNLQIARRTIEVHKMIFFKYAGYFYDVSSFVIDHLNSVQFDNIEPNLDLVNKSSNSYNNFSQGYQLMHRTGKPLGFHPRIWLNGRNVGAIHFKEDILKDLGTIITTGAHTDKLNELDCCRIQNYLEYTISSDYKFDFTNFRRYDLDLLDDERCGRLSKDDVLYKFLSRYNNAWYYYRYGLELLFAKYSIPKPDIYLDSDGFLTDKSGNKLNPFLGGKK